MANNEDKLSRLYREGLGDFAKDPPPEVWSGIKQGLLIRNLVTFKFMTSLNIYSVAVLITVAALTGFLIGRQLHQNNLATTNKNISTIVKGLPEKPQAIQEINKLQNIEHANLIDKPASITITDHQIQHKTSVSTKVKEEPIILSEKPAPVQKTVSNPPPEKGNISKPADTFSKKPVLIDDFKNNEIEKQPSQKNLTNDKNKTEPEQTKKQSEQPNEIFTQKKHKTVQGFYAEIFGAPSLLTYKYEPSTVNQNMTFVNSSKEDEKPSLSYTAGLELGYGLKNIFAQTGINYSDYRSKTLIDILERFTFLTTIWNKDSLWDDSIKRYVFHYDSFNVTKRADSLTSHRSNNSLRYIEIPILLGYRFYGKRSSYAISGGISFGHLSSSGGKTLNPDLKSITANTTETVPFRPWTYYIILRAEAAYLLNKNLSIFIRPGFKYNMNSVFEVYYPVQKSFYTLDLQLGLHYNF